MTATAFAWNATAIVLSRFISDAYNNVHNGNHPDCARRHILAS